MLVLKGEHGVLPHKVELVAAPELPESESELEPPELLVSVVVSSDAAIVLVVDVSSISSESSSDLTNTPPSRNCQA